MEYFLQNKYTKWYFKIIESAKTRINNEGYFEKHHIIPKSIVKNNNIVNLTAKEHYICHLLLTKMCKDKIHKQKMCYALIILQKGKNGKIKRYTSRLYSYFKPLIINATNDHRKLNGKKAADKARGKTYEELYGLDKAIELKAIRSENFKKSFTNKWNDESYREKTITGMKGAKKNDVSNYRKAALIRWADKETRLKMQQSMRGVKKTKREIIGG